MRLLRPWLPLILLVSLTHLAGCGGYVLEGRVVEGTVPAMLFVPADDPQLAEPGVPNARIVVHRDPDRLSRKQVADGYSRVDGRFEIPIGEFGAGWMDEQWLISAWRKDYETVESMLELESSGKQLLIVVRRGRSLAPAGREDVDEIFERHR